MQFACFKAGAVFIPLPDGVTAHEARSYVGLVSCDVIVTLTVEVADVFAGAQAAHGESGVVTYDDLRAGAELEIGGQRGVFASDAAMLQFTSGSTGRPKGVLLDQGNLLANLTQSESLLEDFRGRAAFCSATAVSRDGQRRMPRTPERRRSGALRHAVRSSERPFAACASRAARCC